MTSPLRRLGVFAPAILALAACSAPPTEDVAQSRAALSPSPNDQAAYDFFVGKGLTNFQAAGIVGNLDQESQVDPGAVQAGGPGRGIAQWSVGGRWDTDASDNAVWYAGMQGESVSSLTLQLEFIWYELQTFSGYGLAALRASTNVTDATIAFETNFEGCGTCDEATRISYAEAALAAYGSFDYGAAFVSQSFPLASTALTMTSGETIASFIELKNTGAKAWDTSTHLGTSNPRDRTSAFADGSWLAANRPAGVTGTVAPGDSYKFTFSLHAPTKPGTYLEYFDVVEEGVAWFSNPGQGGPPDDDLEVQIVVVAAPGTPPSTPEDGGVDAHADEDGGAATPSPSGADGGGGGAGTGTGTAGPVGSPKPAPSDDAGATTNGASSNGAPASASGCAMAARAPAGTAPGWVFAFVPIGLAARRRSPRAR